ncbi:DDE superfamily endonuclease [Popillia japonica]|uniref:DDE superfamily endonuclease n=1 Tax=Popillia japonica TaxID=7064 RepID=A0AAW1LTN4_POPJA
METFCKPPKNLSLQGNVSENWRSYGREDDSNIFRNSVLGKKLSKEQLNIPDNHPLSGTNNVTLSFVIVRYEAFGLAEHLLRPYSRQNLNIGQRVFNYRLTRARRYVECTFGILAHKWRVFHSTMLVSEDFAGDITKAGCVLHNFVRRRDGHNFGDSLTNPIRGLDARGTGGPSPGIAIRKRVEEYFMNEGSVPWQYDKL